MKKSVLVLHPSDELKIIALQDELRLSFQNEKGVFKKYPLWIELPEHLSAKDISAVHTEKIYQNEKGLFLSVFVVTDEGKEIQTSLQLILYKNEVEKSEKFEKKFQLYCRIFRIAEGHFENNRYWLTDSIWKKIKK